MAGQGKKKYWFRFNRALVFSMSSVAIAANYILPISALEIPKYSQEFRIAKTPDERQPEAVQQGIEQIPTSQPPVTPQRNQTIDSPIPPSAPTTPTNSNPAPQPSPSNSTPAPTTPTNSNPAPQPSPSNSTPAPTPPTNSNPAPQPSPSNSTPRPSRPINSKPTPQPSPSNSTPRPSRPINSKPTPQPSPSNSTPRPSRPINSKPTPQPTGGGKPVTQPPRNGSSPVSSFQIPNAKKINFVDIAFGILSKGDYQSKGRYFHFYQFEGRENQLIQIRLVGSADQRRSNNLNLRPFMFLLDPNNNVVSKRSSTETTQDAFIFARLPVRGTYTIAVTSQNPGDTGRYSLALRNDRASYALDESDQLTAQSLTLKQNGSPYNVSTFEGKKNQLVSIRVDSINEEFSPYIVLLNSKGERIAADNDKDGVYSALIDRAKLPDDDTYYVIVTSNNPRERGTYRLTVF